MWRNYSPKTFLRQTPNHILKEYFTRKDLLADIDFDALGKTEIEPIAEAIDQLPEEQRTKIEADFRQIFEMACEKGVQLLLEEARFYHDLDLSTIFEKMENHYERAFWVFLNHPRVFTVASDFDYMDRVGGWKPIPVGEGLKPAVGEDDKKHLVKSLSDFYKKQGRGRHCRVDNYLRSEPERHCYFAYPEDYATTEIEIDEKGEFCNRPRKPVFEVIFVYKPENGDLVVCAKGKTDEIKRLQEIFCTRILGLDSLPDETGKRFDLSKLKDKNISFVTDIQDGIESVKLKMLCLDLPGSYKRRITFEASSSDGGQPIHTLIERALNKTNMSLDKMIVTKAKLQFKFAPRDGKKGKTLTFEISIPDRWTLKDDPVDQIAKKYIEKWGLTSG
jgi:hypothetical protein